ncbi:MAG TPA: DsbA family protein [Pyrinomonadaceae bacterium]|nr:DsbA family protein [Pyrinomonadaceae bacterium]
MAEPAVEELRRAEPDVEIVWRAFELRPEPVPTLDPGGEYLTRVWRDGVYPLAARLGITMRLPPIQPRSRRAHEAAKWARREGRFDDFNAALFRAFFERGEDIGDARVLVALAAALGLDADALGRALDTREFETEVLTDERDAELLRITGVPAFVASRRAMLFGVQTVAGLREIVARVRASDTTEQSPDQIETVPLPITPRRRGTPEDV